MNRRAFLGLGATSIGVGALYGTGAFSSVNAGRGVSVNAAEDPENALLGISITYNGEEFGTANQGIPDTAEVAQLSNNLNEDIDSISAEVTSVEDDEDDVLTVANEFELDDPVESGESVAIELGCSGDEAEGVSDVIVTIQAANAQTVTITGKPILIENVDYNCGESDEDDETEDGDIEFIELLATVNTDNQGRPQSVIFEYEITEEADIVFDTTLAATDSERVESTTQGTFEIERGGRAGQQSFPVGVEADIDGGEFCGTSIEEDQAEESVDVC